MNLSEIYKLCIYDIQYDSTSILSLLQQPIQKSKQPENPQQMLATQKLPYTYQQSVGNKQFNTSALTVWADDNYFYLQPNYSKCLIPTVLKIDRKSQIISQINAESFVVPKGATPFYFSLFIGIIDFDGKKLLMLSQTVQVVCSINQRDIFKITKPLFLFYRPGDKNLLNDEQARILINLVIIFQQGMYFSYAYNLTQPLHHVKKLDKSMISSSFNWAQSFQHELSNCNAMWTLPVIQGFVNKIELYINAHKFRIILISRRSIKRGGPWQYTTGLNDIGSAANYVETQQLFWVNDFIFSFVQVRGSVPICWTQKFSYGMPNSIEMTNKSVDENYKIFKKHLGQMLHNREYDNIILVNLLNKESGLQKKLIQNFQYMARKAEKQKTIDLSFCQPSPSKPLSGFRYYYFDVHTRCPNKNYQTLNKFIASQLDPILKSCSFTALHVQSDKNYEIVNLQRGVIRSNCGTCIDRTNIAQSRIAALQLLHILEQLDIKIKDFDQQLNFIDGTGSFATLYRNLWADNGDSISKQYTGTGSTESYAIRKGKLSYMTTIDHGMTSLVRAFRNIRQEDEQKNKTVLFLYRKFQQQGSSTSPQHQSKQLQTKTVKANLDTKIEKIKKQQDKNKQKQTQQKTINNITSATISEQKIL